MKLHNTIPLSLTSSPPKTGSSCTEEGKKMMQQRESKKRGRQVTEDKTKCAKKKMHQKKTTRRPGDGELDEEEEVVGVFDFPWIKDGTMFDFSENEWYLEGTFLSSLRAAIEDEGEFFSQIISCSAAAAGLMLEFLPDDQIVDADDNFTRSDESSSVQNVDNSIWSSVLNQPLGRSL